MATYFSFIKFLNVAKITRLESNDANGGAWRTTYTTRTNQDNNMMYAQIDPYNARYGLLEPTVADKKILVSYNYTDNIFRLQPGMELDDYRTTNLPAAESPSWQYTFNSPELELIVENEYYPSLNVFNSYMAILDKVIVERQLTLNQLGDLMTKSCIQTDNPYDVFDIEFKGVLSTRGKSDYAFLDSKNNLMPYYQSLVKAGNNGKQFKYLLNAAYSLPAIKKLDYEQLTEYLTVLRGLRNQLSGSPSYRFNGFSTHALIASLNNTLIAGGIKETELMKTKPRFVKFNSWITNPTITQQVADGAKINLVLATDVKE